MTWTVRQWLPMPPLVGVTYVGVGLVLFSGFFFVARAAMVVDAQVSIGVAVGAAILGATLLQPVSQRIVSAIGAVVLAVLGGNYIVRFFDPTEPAGAIQTMVSDSAFLVSSGTLLQIHGIESWLLTIVVPATFLTWYFLLRGTVGWSVLTAGILVVIFTLTGDISTTTTLVAISGGTIAVGAHRLHAHGASIGSVDSVVIVAAAIILGSLVVFSAGGLVLGAAGAGAGETGGTGGDDGDLDEESANETATLETTLTTQQELELSGAVDLAPEPRFTVEAEEPALFRTEVYDRYTGTGWVRTDASADADPLPDGDTETVEQTFELITPMQSLPTTAMPRAVDGLDDVEYQQTADGLLQADAPVDANTEYSVTAERLNVSQSTLNTAGSEYPEDIADQYTQLPSDVPDRVRDVTADVTADAETPYETAQVTQEYLMREKEYSLEVPPPEGNVADEFLFEMDAGYCTYYATTMAVMLRAEGIPTRVVSGYNAGHDLDNETRAVLGSNAHAWVEVYFPDIGWVAFDPTPAADWEQARLDAIEDADIDIGPQQELNTTPVTNDSGGPDDSTARAVEDAIDGPGTSAEIDNRVNVTDVDPADYEETEELLRLPGSGRAPRFLLGVVTLTGVTAIGIRRKPVRRGLQPVRMSYQRRKGTPSDVTRAVDRLEWLLGWQYMPRQASETPTEYLERLPATVDPRVREVYELHETVRYAGIDDDQTDRAVSLVNQLIREQIPVIGRLFRRR